MDLHIWVIISLSLLTGCWIQAALGFGMAMVFAPALVLVRPDWIPFIITFVGFYLCCLNTWSEKDAINMKDMTIPMLTRIVGTVVGAWFLSLVSVLWIQLWVSMTVLLVVVASLMSKKFETTPVNLGWAGLFSGFMSTTTGIGGLPMALVMQHTDARTARANLSLYFSIGCIFSMASYAVIGRLSWDIFIASIILSPFVLGGYYLGFKTRKYVNSGRFRLITLSLCSMAALVALFGSILELIN